jgi:repressor LexA
LLEEAHNGLPLVGRVAAGEAILAIENIEAYLEVAPDMFHPRADFLLKVQGRSMKNIGIMDGDLLAVHKTNTAENGAIIVARIEDEVTVKRLKTSSKPYEITLVPENEELDPILVDLRTQNFTIEGVSVGVIRTKF